MHPKIKALQACGAVHWLDWLRWHGTHIYQPSATYQPCACGEHAGMAVGSSMASR